MTRLAAKQLRPACRVRRRVACHSPGTFNSRPLSCVADRVPSPAFTRSHMHMLNTDRIQTEANALTAYLLSPRRTR